jgi:arylsulfatase A-like enzyme
VFSPTSNTDILPTLLYLTGKESPGSLEKRILPGLGGKEDFRRSIFAIEAKENSAFKPIARATVALIKNGKKLIYYTGYPRYDEVFELYDLVEDVEESRDLFTEDTTVGAARLKEELLDVLETANRPYFGN